MLSQAFVIGLTRQNEINYRRPRFRHSVKTFISVLEQLVVCLVNQPLEVT